MIKKAVVAAVAFALTSGIAQAGENKFTKQEGVGMFSGAAAGAVVGGPVGASVGLMIGGILGDSVGTAQRAELHADAARTGPDRHAHRAREGERADRRR